MSCIKHSMDFIKKSNAIHGGRYDYSLVDYKKSKDKVKIICPEHGVFEQSPNNHKRGQGCPECGKIVSNKKKTKGKDIFIKQSNEIHGGRYDYSLVDYKHSHNKVKIICPEHGIFEQSPNSHLQGSGCALCFIERQTSSRDIFIKQSNEIHGGRYDYSLVNYKNAKDKVQIICPEHGIFEQRPDNHIYSQQGCPECISFSYVSNTEKELQDWLSEYIDIENNNRRIISPYEIDIIIPKYKIAIEFNGLYWHSEGVGKTKYYHLNKYILCKEKNYRLIQIWENEWLFKKDIVKSVILNSIGIVDNKIHGRKCKIDTINPKDAKIFYDANHLQGFKGGVHKGLIYNGQLVSLMTIDKRGELQRFVNKKYNIVHGAFSKLLKSFNVTKIYTFADLRYFTGKVYLNNGFKYCYTTSPNYYYFKKCKVIHRRSFQKNLIKQKYHKKELCSFDMGLTEYQNMVNNGFDRIWDCGNMKFEYNKGEINE